jgi:hypothetical protein
MMLQQVWQYLPPYPLPHLMNQPVLEKKGIGENKIHQPRRHHDGGRSAHLVYDARAANKLAPFPVSCLCFGED